jgi:beta-lactam-binding protein with PASTA domain/tRNA A-37 threonylcarbamoyl transferase component Bud32
MRVAEDDGMPELDEHVVIDGRYRIVRHVGSGGMADVYCAEDTHLGRQVAVKLLYRRFAQDKEFVERFRREASSAAALQHPNVVSVYDRGEFDGTYYIAMEFCEGESLKDVITREAPLDPGQAIAITRQILVAARFAHRRGVIHRDLKPQNVIIGADPADGEVNVKVADFGIARADDSEITEVGAIMGTAQYLSPEQAQGRSVSAASDLYSVGVILFEMLTGRAPFEGDSAVAIALKHVSQPPPSVRQFRPEIPTELEAVVMKSLAKDPAQRYTEADSFLRDLDGAEAALAREGHDIGRTAAFVPIDVAPAPAAEAAPAEPPPPPPAGEQPAPGPRRRRRAALLALVAFAALAAIIGGTYLLLKPERVNVPLVLGQTLDSARQELDAAGFKVDIDRRTDAAPVNTVFRQVPSADTKAEKDSTVTLFVSNGPSTVKVPDVVGLPQQDAAKRVRRAHLRPFTERENSGSVAEGNVMRSDPGPGTAIERGSRVTLVVSSGPKEVVVPDVTGLDQDDAFARLEKLGLNVRSRQRSSSEPADTVVEQTPAGGLRVDEGATITLFVSDGKLQEVPDVTGLDQADAESEIRSAGFRADVTTKAVEEPDRDGTVLSQTPSAGKERQRGATVTITVGMLTTPEPAPTPEPGAGG